ncbi:MAG TPA: aldolase/citrate lyase family protein, partial [Ktedonobacteraceae bacterium]|nr:aldolase/citrate lyase family protein [Ktedonobacteraceae bacterium]
MKQPVIRSYLYVPGSNQHMLEKAMSTDADALILDLEDAVAPNRKVEARHNVAQVLQIQPVKPLFVRINAINSGLAMDDIAEVAGPWLTGLRLPKTEKPEEVHLVAEQLDRLGCQAGIQCVIESAIGVERAYEIASAHPRITTLGVGEADLAADLGISTEDGFAYIRSRIVVAARAAGLAPPVQSVYTNIRDL